MAYLVQRDTITDAWVAALDHLHSHNQEEYGLVVEIVDPLPDHTDLSIIRRVDDTLAEQGYDPVATVANTIFPAKLAASSPDRTTFYSRYETILPRLRRLKGNHKGLYFERLIAYPLQTDPIRTNQLETIIGDLTGQLRRREQGQGPLGSVYEGQIFAPGKDRLPQGFPCMSSLSFQLDGSRLLLTATYRNQYHIRRALGNYLGLAQLHSFVCAEVGLTQGPLTIHAFHSRIDLGKKTTIILLRDCNAHISPPQLVTRSA